MLSLWLTFGSTFNTSFHRCLMGQVAVYWTGSLTISVPIAPSNRNPLKRGLAWETQVMPMAGRTHEGFSQLEKVYVNVGTGLVYVKIDGEMTSSAWTLPQVGGHRRSATPIYPAEENPRDRTRRAQLAISPIRPTLQAPRTME